MRPHTSLSFWERLSVSKLAEFVVGDCAIIFWLKGSETMLVERFRKRGFVPLRDAAEKAVRACHLCDITIDVIITTTAIHDEGYSYLEDDLEKLIKAVTPSREIARGQNRILLTIEDLSLIDQKNWQGFRRDLLDRGVSPIDAESRASRLVQTIIPLTRKRLEQQFLRILMHEIVHVWTMRTSEARRLFERSRERLRALLSKRRSLVTLQNALALHPDDHALLRDAYLLFRERLLWYSHMACEEGFAEYLARLLKEGAVSPDGSYGYLCADSFEESLKAFEAFGTQKGFGGAVQQERFFTAINQMDHLWEKARYALCTTIPKTLLINGRSLESIARMTSPQMLRAYEDACKELRIKPYFASRPGTDAIFNFGAAAIRLNALRKKLGVR